MTSQPGCFSATSGALVVCTELWIFWWNTDALFHFGALAAFDEMDQAADFHNIVSPLNKQYQILWNSKVFAYCHNED